MPSGLKSLSVDHNEQSFRLVLFRTDLCSLTWFEKKDVKLDLGSYFFGDYWGFWILKLVPFLETNLLMMSPPFWGCSHWSAVKDLIWFDVLSAIFLFASFIRACKMLFWLSFINLILAEFKFLKLGRFLPAYFVFGLFPPKAMGGSLGVVCNGEA